MTERIVTTLPDAQTIVAKLQDGFAMESDGRRVYETFADNVANKQRVPHGINISWELAVHRVASQYGAVPMLSAIMDLNFDLCMASLFADEPEFLAELMDVRNTVRGMRS